MTFEELVAVVIGYAIQFKCTIKVAINDLEFDGPDGSFGPGVGDVVRLLNHFGDRVEMNVNPDANGRGLCYSYTEERIAADDAEVAELLSL